MKDSNKDSDEVCIMALDIKALLQREVGMMRRANSGSATPWFNSFVTSKRHAKRKGHKRILGSDAFEAQRCHELIPIRQTILQQFYCKQKNYFVLKDLN
jgi:hypothetical protein